MTIGAATMTVSGNAVRKGALRGNPSKAGGSLKRWPTGWTGLQGVSKVRSRRYGH